MEPGPAEEILNRMAKRRKLRDGTYEAKTCPKFVLIDDARSFNNASALNGQVLVEKGEGLYATPTGEELQAIAIAYPDLIKHWRLPEGLWP